MTRAELQPYAIIVAASILLIAPALFVPAMTHESFWIDISWADQFSAALKRGELYPRWLPDSHGGLGAPVFYFYPPLAFYVTGLFALLGLGTYASIIAAFWAGFLGSGLAMYQWLKGWTARPLLGAIVYMAAPYHLLDFYRRGALAEAIIFAVLPLLAIALRRAGAGRGFVPLAFAYAALVLTHLPVALLASLMLVAPYAGWLVWQRRAAAVPIALGLAGGLGLAATYLLPALTMQQWISTQFLWIDGRFDAANWSILRPDRWQSTGGMLLEMLLAGGVTFAALILLWARRRDGWAWLAIAVSALAIGLVPWLWDIDLMAKVQFPWRAFAIAEFALATAIAASPLRPVPIAVALAPLAGLSALFLKPLPPSYDVSVPELLRLHHDVLEYQPAGAPSPYHWYARWAIELAARQPAIERRDGMVIARTFYFPAWQVRCGTRTVASFPDPKNRLLAWRDPAPDCRPVLVPPAAQRSGTMISIGTLLLLIGMLMRRSRHHSKSP